MKKENLLHPVRIRIIGTLAMFGPQTTNELKSRLKHIAQATLYRNIQYLRDNDIISIADAKVVKGNTEYTYQLNIEMAQLSEDELNNMSKEEQSLLFLQYTSLLNEYFTNYLNKLSSDENNKFTMSLVPLMLNDQEYEELQNDIYKLMMRQLDKDTEGRKPRLCSFVLFPNV